MPAHELAAHPDELGDRDRSRRRALDRDASVDDVKVLRGRLERFGCDLEQLAARLPGGLIDGGADAVGHLAAARRGAERRARRVRRLDADLVRRDAERLGGDDRKTGRGAADVW